MYSITGIQHNTLWNHAENYLNVFGKQYRLIHTTCDQMMLRETPTKRSIMTTALKILSYATIILPLIAWTIRNHYRTQHKFIYLTGEEENYKKDLSKIAKEANEILKNQVLPFDKKTHRFDDVLPPQQTLLWVNNHIGFLSPLHANTVTLPNNQTYIAAQAPHNPESQELFWRCCYENAELIIDLTQPKDHIAPYYPQEVYTCKEISPRLHVICTKKTELNEQIQAFEYKLTMDKLPGKIIQRIHYNGWPDHNPAPIEDLFEINRITEAFKDSKILVHCRAGVGRTGTFIVSHYIHQKKNKGLTVDYNKILDYVKTGKIARGSRFVENEHHLRMLHCYANLKL